MATKEELNNQKDLNSEIENSISLEQQILDLLSNRRGIDSNILSDQQSINNVLKDQVKNMDFEVVQRKKIRDLSANISKIASDSYSISKDQLGLTSTNVDIAKKQETLSKSIVLLSQQKSQLLSSINNGTASNAELNKDIADSISTQVSSAGKLKNDLGKIAKDSKDISGNFGVKSFGGLSEITKSIPGLSKFSAPFEDASEAARSQAASNMENLKSLKTGKGLNTEKIKSLGLEGKLIGKNGKALTGTAASAKAKALGLTKAAKGGMSPMIAGIKSLGPALKKALGPLGLLISLVAAIVEADKAASKMAKSMNMSYSDALQMRSELTNAAAASGNIFVNTKGMQESLMAVNSTLGTNVMLSGEMLTQMTEMREMAGFTNEELQGIAAISLTTGASMNDVTGEFMAQAKLSSIQNGVLLNEKTLLKGIKDVTAATTLSLGQDAGLIGKTIATAKSLGMEMSKIEGIADSLLNFESSIGAEMEAELLTGKSLNLEKAREFALNNDIAGVAREIAKQTGSAADFGKMNRIQQEALAKAVGMNREELASSLFLREQLKGLTGDAAKQAEADFQRRVDILGVAGAQRELEQKGVDGLREQVGMADKLGAVMSKLEEIFVVVGQALMPIFDIFVSIFDIVGPIMKLLNPFIQFAATGFSFLGDILSLDFGFTKTVASIKKTEDASQAVFGTSADIYGRYGADGKKTGDMNSPADGKTMVSTKEGGLFELSPNDDLIAYPGASKMANDASNGGAGVVNNTSSSGINIEPLVTRMAAVENILIQILQKETGIYLDSNKIGKTMQLSNSRMG
tara:strand:- start:775 stop:3186 length:2412 start_codon:yes stop_codon:yes gene_type:complete